MTWTPITIRYAGAVAAAAGPTRFILAPHVDALPDGHPIKRVVAFMCVYARDVLAGKLPGPYNDVDAARFARSVIVDPQVLAERWHDSDEQLAERLEIPVREIPAARAELAPDRDHPLTGNLAGRAAGASSTYMVRLPTPGEDLRALWAMTPAQRVAAMRRGELTLKQCFAWAARHPDEIPTVDGVLEFLADVDELRRAIH